MPFCSQLVVQEIATMMRQGLKPIIVVLNNDGCKLYALLRALAAMADPLSQT